MKQLTCPLDGKPCETDCPDRYHDQPEAVKAATASYQRASDKIARFVEEMMEPDPMGEIRTEEAYQQYQMWCARNGHRAEAMPNFKQSMEAHTTIRKQRPRGAGRTATKISLILGMKWGCGPVWSGFFTGYKEISRVEGTRNCRTTPDHTLRRNAFRVWAKITERRTHERTENLPVVLFEQRGP